MSVRKNTCWNLFGSASPMFIGLLAMPYILGELKVERLGVLTLIWALIGYFSIFDFGLGRALTHKVSSLRALGGAIQLRSACQSGLFLMFCTGLAGSALVILAVSIIGIHWLNLSDSIFEDARGSILLAGISIPIATGTSGLKGILEGFEDFQTVNIYRFVLGVANFLSPVIAILFFGPSLTAIVFLLVVSRFIVMLMHVYSVSQRIPKLFIQKKLEGNRDSSDLLIFGSWMTLSNLLSPLMVVADRFVISSLEGASKVAYYTVPSEFLLRLLILPAALTSTLFPVFTKKSLLDQEGVGLLYKKALKTIALAMLPLMLVLALGSYLGLSMWLGSDFADNSYLIVVVLSFGIYFNSIAQIPHMVIQAHGKVKTTSLIHLAEFAVYAPTMYLMVEVFGLMGAACSWVARAFIDCAFLHFFADRIIKDGE